MCSPTLRSPLLGITSKCSVTVHLILKESSEFPRFFKERKLFMGSKWGVGEDQLIGGHLDHVINYFTCFGCLTLSAINNFGSITESVLRKMLMLAAFLSSIGVSCRTCARGRTRLPARLTEACTRLWIRYDSLRQITQNNCHQLGFLCLTAHQTTTTNSRNKGNDPNLILSVVWRSLIIILFMTDLISDKSK